MPATNLLRAAATTLALLVTAGVQGAVIAPELTAELAVRAPEDEVPVIVSFADKVDYSPGLTCNSYSAFAADLDLDGDLDLAVACNGTNQVAVLENNGSGAFGNPVNYPTGDGPVSVFATDLDKDGDLDLALVNEADYSVSVLKNNGNGTFAPKVDYPAGNGPLAVKSVFSCDVDRDGYLDLATANYAGNTVSVLRNYGDGTFASKVDYGVGAGPSSLFAADLDLDGDWELATANYSGSTVSILMNISAACSAIPGDANASENLTLGDIISAVNYIFNKPGCSPSPYCWLTGSLCRGDWNGNGTITLADVIHGLKFIFNKPGGPWAPVPTGVCCQAAK